MAVYQRGTSTAGLDIDSSSPLAVVIDSTSSRDSTTTWHASLAIGGITCASSVNIITEALLKKDWIKNISVNLIAHNAAVDFVGEAHRDDLVEAIENLGYEAILKSVVNLSDSASVTGLRGATRTVEILVKGMFCEDCPCRILAALESYFGNRVQVKMAPTTKTPVLRLVYTAELPRVTIRHILAIIWNENQAWELSIYQPPSIEDYSQQIQAREQRRLYIRVLVTFILSLPTLVIGIIYMIFVPLNDPRRQYLDKPLLDRVSCAQWALFILSTPVYFCCADLFHRRAIKELQSLWRGDNTTTPFFQRFYRFGSMSLLMSLGTSIAYLSSVTQLVANDVSHTEKVVNNHCFHFDSVVFLTFFLLLGRSIESYSKSKTDDAVSLLGSMRPTDALLIDRELDNGKQGDITKLINVNLLELGDIIKVRPGSSPACDGMIVHGETEFDESSLTGESKPVKKIVGDQVFSGTINKGPPISAQVTGLAGDSMLDQIISVVREGQTRRAPIERIADSLTSYFIPFITALAILTWATWLTLAYSNTIPASYLDGSPGWIVWSLQFAIAVFVVACPCGLALAAPTALFVGCGLAAKHGILVKGGGEAFELVSKLDCVVFDKTGTLTVGEEPVVTDFEFSKDFFEVPPVAPPSARKWFLK